MYNRKVILYIERKKSMVKKKMISGLVSLAMCVSTLTAPIGEANVGEWKIGQDAKAAAEASNGYKVEGTDSIGRYVSQLYMDNEESEEIGSLYESGYNICDLSYNDAEHKISVLTTQEKDCTLLISIINSETEAVVKKYEIKRKAGNEDYEEINLNMAELPEYFKIKGVLTSELGLELSEPFYNEENVRYVQEIKRSDIHDYPAENLINLDEDEKTNFIVLSEDIVRAESDEETNVLVSSDYDNGKYVFENADETITNLKAGDKFFIQPEEEIIAIEVKEIKEHDGKIEITEDQEKSIDDMFDVVKLEGEIHMENAEMNEDFQSDAEAEASINKDNGTLDFNYSRLVGRTANGIGKKAISEIITEPLEVKKTAEFSVTPVKRLSVGGNIIITGKFNFYKTKNDYNLKIDIDKKVKGKIDISLSDKRASTAGKDPEEIDFMENLQNEYKQSRIDQMGLSDVVDVEVNLADIIIPICPAVTLNLLPGFAISFSGTADIPYEISGKSGLTATKTTREKIGSPWKSEDFSPKVIGTLTFSVRISPSLQVLCGVVALKLTVSFGLEIYSTMDVNVENIIETFDNGYISDKTFYRPEKNDESIHLCNLCFNVTVSFFVDVSYTISFLKLKKFTFSGTILNVKKPWMKGHIGLSPLNIGFGACDNKAYKVSMDISKIIDDENAVVLNLTVDGVEIISSNTYAEFYSKNGSHSYKITYSYSDNGATKNKTITGKYSVNDEAVSLPQTTINGSVGASDDESEDREIDIEGEHYTDIQQALSEEDEIIVEAGELGENVSYMLYDDGLLYISGYGPIINDINNLRLVGRQSSLIKNIVIENTRDIYREQIYENGITGEELEQLEKECEFELSDSAVITEIGDSWFYNCDNLESVTMPDTIERIGVYAFNNADNLKDLYVTYWDKDSTGKYFYNKGGFDKSNVKTIGFGAFENCKLLNNFAFNDSLEYIGGQAFQSCSCFTDIVIPDSVTFIGNSAFSGLIYVLSICILS